MDHSGIAIVFGELPRDMLFASVRDAKLFVCGEVTLRDVVERFETREALRTQRNRTINFCQVHPSKHLVTPYQQTIK